MSTIRCDGCGEYREWDGYTLVKGCSCLGKIGEPTVYDELLEEKKMTRRQVFDLIDAEREYQEEQFDAGRWEQMAQSPAEYMNDIRYYTRKAEAVLTETGSDYKCMAEILKIAALAVACMEKNDTPRR